MVLKEEKALSMAEVADMIGDSESEKDLKKFISEFVSLPGDKARELREELSGLGILRLKDIHIVKIIDFLPRDASDLNKLLGDVSLEQGEIDKILDVVKKY